MVLWPGWSDPETASTALPVARPSASAWTCTFASALRETLASSRSRSRGLGSKACDPTARVASRERAPGGRPGKRIGREGRAPSARAVPEVPRWVGPAWLRQAVPLRDVRGEQRVRQRRPRADEDGAGVLAGPGHQPIGGEGGMRGLRDRDVAVTPEPLEPADDPGPRGTRADSRVGLVHRVLLDDVGRILAQSGAQAGL